VVDAEGEGDLLGLFGNIDDASLLDDLEIFDPSGIVTDHQLRENKVSSVGGGNNVNPAKKWDWGLKFGRQGSAGGPVESVSFGLRAPDLTIDQIGIGRASQRPARPIPIYVGC